MVVPMANYTARDARTAELHAMIEEGKRPKPPDPLRAYCACGTEVRWDVCGKLYCSRCLPVEHREVFLPDARPEDLEVWGLHSSK